jgi:hypothetical protein
MEKEIENNVSINDTTSQNNNNKENEMFRNENTQKDQITLRNIDFYCTPAKKLILNPIFTPPQIIPSPSPNNNNIFSPPSLSQKNNNVSPSPSQKNNNVSPSPSQKNNNVSPSPSPNNNNVSSSPSPNNNNTPPPQLILPKKGYYIKNIRVKEVKLFEEIRCAHTPKKLMFEQIKKKGVIISLSSFYIITQHIKKPKKRTDCCEICKRGRYLLLKAENSPLNPNEEDELTAYHCHNIIQKRCKKSMDDKESNLEEGEGNVVFDFKESWNTRTFMGEETSFDHWHPNPISHIAYVLTWKNNGEVKRKVYNYLSDNNKHNSKFTIETLNMLIKEDEMKIISRINLYCDVGPHFYNQYTIHEIFNTHLFTTKKTTLTFFGEHHGKCYCDAAFGILTQVVKSFLPLPTIQTSSDLVAFFNNIKNDKSSCFRKIKEEYIFREYVL